MPARNLNGSGSGQLGWTVESERRDLNPRPPLPQSGALPSCATPRQIQAITVHPGVLVASASVASVGFDCPFHSGERGVRLRFA